MRNRNLKASVTISTHKTMIAIISMLLFTATPQAYGLGNLGMILEKFNFLNPLSWNWGSTPKFFVFGSESVFVGAAPMGPNGTYVNVDFNLMMFQRSGGFTSDRDNVVDQLNKVLDKLKTNEKVEIPIYTISKNGVSKPVKAFFETRVDPNQQNMDLLNNEIYFINRLNGYVSPSCEFNSSFILKSSDPGPAMFFGVTVKNQTPYQELNNKKVPIEK